MTKTIEDQYQKKTPIEHILLRPDTYIGSVEPETLTTYTLNDNKISLKQITYVPGLYKIFDEIIVNAADNKIRDPKMQVIKVDIDQENNIISVFNDGKGIPIVLHKKENVYIPELIFGQLLTSSNYDDDEKKVTGGRNGYGAKLCNIFSKEFIIETADGKKKYRQVFSNNMSDKEEPEIEKYSGLQYTKIIFKPDLKRFGMSKLDDDVVSLLKKRVFDLSGIVKKIKVYLNEERLEIRSFVDYCKLYLKNDEEEPNNLIHTVVNNRWEIVFIPSEEQFQQVSFVNSISTIKGGTHVNHVLDQLIEPIIEFIKKKEKGLIVKPLQVKSNIFLFVNCLIENPSFDSQTKENLTLNAKNFGSKCTPIDDLLKNILKSSIFIEKIVGFAKAKQSAQLKKTDGVKTSRLTGIPKLDDANMAGTKNSQRCTLILTEGDSAKALAVSGLSVVGRDLYGVFPLRGKLLNVREANHKQIMDNNEIGAIKKILGLQHGKEYSSTESLRYGHIMIMTDQDHDGSHIKGLLINFFDHFFPSLLKLNDFLQEFITPIVRVTRKKDENKRNVNNEGNTLDFYTLPEFYTWQESISDIHLYKVKYYKGLGTSTSADARYYFSNLGKHVKSFTPLINDDRDLLNLAFNKKKADARKTWLKEFVPGTFLDNNPSIISISDFVNKELILFSMADNIRSIPSLIDGLKPGQRKVIFCCFKRKLTSEMKVAQLAGYVSEHSAYHHGETNLCSTIVNLAQNFVGANNISFLVPAGQFGTRLQGGKDAASPRYIFTLLERLTRFIFHENDDAILKYLTDDNQSIEPEYYVPIIPTILINGSEGIGTGWSTTIPNYNVIDITNNIINLIEGRDINPMHPYYRGFKGTIEECGPVVIKEKRAYNKKNKKVDSNKELESNELKINDNNISLEATERNNFNEELNLLNENEEINTATRYKCTGNYSIDGNSIEITELPIGTWTQNYKEFLEGLVTDGDIKGFNEYHTENTVYFKITSIGNKITCENIEKKLKLSTTISTNNFVCFDQRGFIKKYNGPEEILREFYTTRLEFYIKRKEFMSKKLYDDLIKLENKVRFIKEVVEGKLIISKRKKELIEMELKKKEFILIENSYDYLLSMSILSLTYERIDKLNSERNEKKTEYEALMKKSSKDLWLDDLNLFMNEYKKEMDEDMKNRREEEEKRDKSKGKKKSVKKDDGFVVKRRIIKN
ncbi:DNA topoisomerase 2 [Conglomerata obtusa]